MSQLCRVAWQGEGKVYAKARAPGTNLGTVYRQLPARPQNQQRAEWPRGRSASSRAPTVCQAWGLVALRAAHDRPSWVTDLFLWLLVLPNISQLPFFL